MVLNFIARHFWKRHGFYFSGKVSERMRCEESKKCLHLHICPIDFDDTGWTVNDAVFRSIHSPSKCCHVWLDKNFDPSLLTNKLLTCFHGNEANFFWKNKFKIGDSKKLSFSKSPILNIFSWKFHWLVLGLVELIDVMDIDVAQPIWSWGCLTQRVKFVMTA